MAASQAAWPEWSAMPFEERAAIFLRAAELLAGSWRSTVNAATMLNQSKTCYQAEIDSACELVDFLRFNVAFAEALYGQQPVSSPGIWNYVEYRALEGFVFAVTPFNFTAIAGNLPTSAAIMGNTVLWKPRLLGAAVGLLRREAARGGRSAAGSDQLRAGPGSDGGRSRAGQPPPGGHPLHRFDAGVPAHVADDRRPDSGLPHVPADRRRDRRQGLRVRPSLGRRGGPEHGADPWFLRVPGAEMLRGIAGLHSRVALGRGCANGFATSWRR